MATSSVNFVNSLGAGSGVDTKTLAQSLVDAEKAPRADAINTKIKAEQAKITGQGAIKSLLATLQTALAKFNDANEFSSITPSNSQASAFGVTAGTSTAAGTYSVAVTSTAQATRLATESVTATGVPNNSLNAGAPFTLELSIGKEAPFTTQSVTVSTDTPKGIVDAVNASTTTSGVSAQLINTGNGYAVVFSGKTGAANAFSVSGLPSGASMRATPLQTATDAALTINGLPITSSTNQITDAIPGVTLDLYAATTAGTPARLDLSRQTTDIKANLQGLVTAYNDFDDGLKVLGDKGSTVSQFGGALAGDSLLQTVRNQIRSMFTKDAKVYTNGDSTQAVLNPDVNAAWQAGLGFDRTGKMTLDTAKLDSALAKNFDQVVTLFTANQNSQGIFSTAPGGLAGDAVKNIDRMLRSTGILAQQTTYANDKITAYNKQLTVLNDRMALLLARYTKQFATMDSIVGQSKSTGTNLKSTFDGMMKSMTG